MNIIDFGAVYDRNPQANREGFKYHPSGHKDYPQLWEPFSAVVPLVDRSHDMIQGLVSVNTFITALRAYRIRFEGCWSNQTTRFRLSPIQPTARLWSDSRVYSSALFKKPSVKDHNIRGGEHVMFTSNHINEAGEKVVHWYVGRVLFFFEYDLKTSRSNCGSFYAIAEIMKLHDVANHSESIPKVLPYEPNERYKKYAVFDVADIVSVVGLIADGTNSKWMYVVSPSTAFNKNMKLTAGKVGNLQH